MRSNMPLKLNLTLRPIDIVQYFQQLQLDKQAPRADRLILNEISRFYERVQQTKTFDLNKPLTLEQYFELASILVRTREDIRDKQPTLLLLSLINAFGSDFFPLLRELHRDKKLNMENFKNLYEVSTFEKKAEEPLPILSHPPRVVAPEDLTPEGDLKVTHKTKLIAMVHEKVKAGEKSGRVTKRELEKALKKEFPDAKDIEAPTCSAQFFVDEKGKVDIYWLYKGEKYEVVNRIWILEQIEQLEKTLPRGYKGTFSKDKIPPDKNGKIATCGAEFTINENKKAEVTWVFDTGKLKDDDLVTESQYGRLVSKGTFGKIKVAQKELDSKDTAKKKKWFLLKTQVPQGETEFNVARQEGVAIAKTVRRSPSHEDKEQEEILMEYLQGPTLLEMRDRILPPLLWMELCVNLLERIIQFHERNLKEEGSIQIHRDIKHTNIIALGCAVGLLDFGGTKKLARGVKEEVISEGCGSPGFASPDIFKSKKYGIQSEMYALGMTMAYFLNLLTQGKINEFADIQDEGKEIPYFNLPQAYDPELDENPAIPDEKKRTEILDFIRRMVNQSPDAEPPKDLREGVSFFKKHYEDFIKTTTLRVCFINLDEFIDSSPENKKAFIQHAGKYDIVQPVKYGGAHTPKEYALARREWDDHLKNMLGRKDIPLEKGAIWKLPIEMKKCDDWYNDPRKKFSYEFITEKLDEKEIEKLTEKRIGIKKLEYPVSSVARSRNGR